jgi:seryl-tRNA synthetase
MIHINYIIQDKQKVKDGLKKRNLFLDEKIDFLYDKEIERKKTNTELEGLRAQANKINWKENRDLALELKDKIKVFDHDIKQIEDEIFNVLITIPNFAHEDVDFGKGYDDNKVIFENQKNKETGKLTHWELAEKYNIIDFNLGNKLTGNGFPVYVNKGARLQRAIINFCLDEAVKYGFTEYQVPHLVNKETVYATGQYPDKEGQMYHIEKDDLYLIPTAEVPLTNIYRNTIVDELPILLTGYTPCFRREAGGYGKDTKGLNRIHQFDKIELVCITTQEDGLTRLEVMREYIQGLLDKLDIKYRVLKLCGAELPFGGAKAYDIEAWCPVQAKWLEVVTVTNFDTFQANRLNCKYKKDGKNKLVHTLNGTGLALPRIVATLLETHQVEDGILIPEALVEYTGFNKI